MPSAPRSTASVDDGRVVGDEVARGVPDTSGPSPAVDGGRRRSGRRWHGRRRRARGSERRSSRSASAAHGTSGPPRSVVTMPQPAPRRGAATIAVSTIGWGRATRPASSRIGTRKISSSPSPPSASGTSSDSTPIASRLSHTPRSSSPAGASHAARTTAGVASLASSSRTASRNATWSSVSANLIGGAPGRARRRCCAGSRWCRRRSGRTGRTASPCSTAPSSSASGPSRSRAISCSSTSSSVHQSLVRLASAPGLAPARQPRDGGQRLLLVGLGVHPRRRPRAGAGSASPCSAARATSRSAVARNRPGERSVRPRSEPAVAMATAHRPRARRAPRRRGRRRRRGTRRRRTPRRSPRRRRGGRSRARSRPGCRAARSK